MRGIKQVSETNVSTSVKQWDSMLQRICTNMKDRKQEQRRAHEHGGVEGVDHSVIWLIIRQLRERQRSALNGESF